MADTIKKGDFIELEYTGKTEDGMIFDTTSESIAKKNGIHSQGAKYGPAIVCVGDGHVVPGLDSEIEGKEVGTDYKISVSPEKGFGKKDAKLIQLISTGKFRKENIQPMPGLQVNIDGTYGIVKSVSGGRTLVDFNHPLSGQNLIYDIKIVKIVNDDREKIKAMIELRLGLKDIEVEFNEGKATIITKKDLKIPDEITKEISNEFSKRIPSLKSMEFASKKHEKPEQEGKEAQ